MKSKGFAFRVLIYVTVVVIAILISLLYLIQVQTNRKNAYNSSSLLIDQLKNTITNNDERVRSLTASLKEDYITRAKAVSYILDKNPSIEKQITELAWIANLVSGDESRWPITSLIVGYSSINR